MANEITESEAQELLRQFSENKANVHSFFTNVVKSDDTLKIGNLNDAELGVSKLPVRTYKELELFANEVANQPEWGKYFKQMSEIQTASSLSKEGFLLRQVQTTKKELADVTSKPKENAGWFKSKKTENTTNQNG